jgi:hypothetical protein
MNLFILHHNPITAARLLYDYGEQRANKMITETLQMCACLQHYHSITDKIVKVDGTYYKNRPQICNHPVTLWIKKDPKHFVWVAHYLAALYVQYKIRHPSSPKFANVRHNAELLSSQAWLLMSEPVPKDGFCWHEEITFLNYAKSKEKGLDFTHIANVHEAYKAYLNAQN